MESGWVVAVDIGGTFTDGVAMSPSGDLVHAKVATIPDDRAGGAIDCVKALAHELGLSVRELLGTTTRFAHGQTATVNAMVQRRGAKTGLITTAGFRDTLAMMNVSRSAGLPQHEQEDVLRGQKPEPLVPPELTKEVVERVDAEGRVVIPLDEASVHTALASLLAQGVEAIAVCLLWSFRNPQHEERVRDMIHAAASEVMVAISSEVAPVIGEYERTFTTVANAYLAPALDRYVHRLQGDLSSSGLRTPALIMQSNGGVIPASEAPKVAVTTIVSALAGGVTGSAALAETLNLPNVITADMGGTSFEVAVISDGEPVVSEHPLAPRMGPYVWRWKMAVPTLEITAIGSGGGSIAWLQEGVIKVGPHSAQAQPGPACYGKGGVEPTITDADLVLGYLNPTFFLGGRIPVYPEKADEAIRTRIADPLGISVVDAARGIVEVANNQMADLTRHLTVRAGYDPRDFHLVAFGGAGPLHVGHFGPELEVQGIIVPGAGLAAAYSALGLARADYRQTFEQSFQLWAPFDPSEIERNFLRLEERARRTFADWGVPSDTIELLRYADVRFGRQIRVVEVPIGAAIVTSADADAIIHTFQARYETLYGSGTAVPEAGFEITGQRIRAIGKVQPPRMRSWPLALPDPSAAKKGVRDVYLLSHGEYAPTPLYDGNQLRPGNRLSGPSVVEYSGSTVLLHPGQEALIDGYCNCVITVPNGSREKEL